MTHYRFTLSIINLVILLPLASCAFMSQPGPQKSAIEGNQPSYNLIDIHSRKDLPDADTNFGLGRTPPRIKGSAYSDKVRARDSLRFIITDLTEQSPFYTRGEPFSFGPVEVPEDGRVNIPYVGELEVIGKDLADISSQLDGRLKPISKSAQASVGRANRIPHTANVIGEVKNPGPVPLEKDQITSLDLLAVSGGSVNADHLYNYTLRRNGQDYTFDYQGFRKNPFPIEEGDLLSVSSDTSHRFYVMGAINKPMTVPFPVPSPTLADAIGAASGFDERRSDPSGVFIFRKGNPDTVYTLNLKDPASVLLTQRFSIRGEDIVYVTEAPLTRWSRLISQLLPVTQLSQAAYNFDRIRQ
jgi:protein involved in polysaccharide export with SLBB domain